MSGSFERLFKRFLRFNPLLKLDTAAAQAATVLKFNMPYNIDTQD